MSRMQIFYSHDLTRTCFPRMYWVLPSECSRPEGGSIQSVIDSWSDFIGRDRDSCHLGTLSTILQHFTHTMKPSDPLLLADVTLRAKLTPLDTQPPSGSPRVTILSASPVQTLVHCVVKPSRPADLKSSSNISLPFARITGPRKRLSRYN